jgi:hypothetical protein
MIRKWLAIGISIIAVILLTLTSLSNVVGYQSVQTSQQNLINERINQKELLFQTIVDIANNKEIQRIILKSQMSRGIFPSSEMPVITTTQIRQMYFLGLILSKVISKSRIQSIIGKYQFNNQEMQKEISTVIERNTILNAEITQLKDSDCDCDNENSMQQDASVLCEILLFMIYGFLFLGFFILNILIIFRDGFHLPGLIPLTFIGISFLLAWISFIFYSLFDCPPIPYTI